MMSPQSKKVPSALRHGAYSAIAVLPTESQAEFDELHRALITELKPNGAIENDNVATIARLIWRKKNLGTLRVARLAQNRMSIVSDEIVAAKCPDECEIRHPESDTLMQSAENKVRHELGDAYGLIEVGNAASFEGLTEELDIEERIGGMIDRCLKRLLFVRGLKSMTGVATSEVPRIAGPSDAV